MNEDVNARIEYLKELALKKLMEELRASTESAKESSKRHTVFKVDKHCEKRPVKEDDSWCVELQRKLVGNAPNGYIVRIPEYFDGMILVVDGAIKAFKFFPDTLYIQVNPIPTGDAYIIEHNQNEWILHRVSKKGKAS